MQYLIYITKNLITNIAFKLINFILIFAILLFVVPTIRTFKIDELVSIAINALCLFFETLIIQILLIKFKFNQNYLQFFWVFITCFTFYLFFLSNLFGNILFSGDSTGVIFEIPVSIIEGISLFYILKLKIISKNEVKKVSFLKCLLYSFIINAFSTICGIYVAPKLMSLYFNLSSTY